MASRLHASYVSIFHRLGDVLAIYISLYVVFKINKLVINHEALLAYLGMITIFQCMAEITDFYRHWKGVSLSRELCLSLQNVSISTVIFYGITLFMTKIDLFMVLQSFIFIILFISCFRVGLRLAYSIFFQIFGVSNQVLIVGDSARAKKLFQDLLATKWAGDHPIGLFSSNREYDDKVFNGGLAEVLQYVRSNTVSKVYIVVDQKNMKATEALVKVLSDTTCSTILVPDLFNFNLLYSRVEEINGIPAIPLYDTCISGINKLLKRIEDICVASVILLLISPVLICISIAIKMTSSGPVFFKQIRYGLNGKQILVYKFRTMMVMENGADVKQAVKNDPRVTSVGRFLRRTSLDELPQFFNVIIGNMSVVGPRPHAVAHNEEYRKLIPGYMLRHTVKPGITGLAQINGWRGETDTLDKMEKRIECDLEYIRTWSLFLDIKIIFLTVFKGFIHKAAY